jgi:hypothetical protein
MTMIELMALAFYDEMGRQREIYGWPCQKHPPFDEWNEDERDAAVASMEAALNVHREWSVE